MFYCMLSYNNKISGKVPQENSAENLFLCIFNSAVLRLKLCKVMGISTAHEEIKSQRFIFQTVCGSLIFTTPYSFVLFLNVDHTSFSGRGFDHPWIHAMGSIQIF